VRALAGWAVGGVLVLGIVQLFLLLRPAGREAAPGALTVEQLERLPIHQRTIDPATLERADMVDTGAR